MSASNQTIVISDSEDEDMDLTVIHQAHMETTPPTPPPDTQSSPEGGEGSGDTISMFYESRSPNNGRELKPDYESINGLSLAGTSLILPSNDDSIRERPASTPIETQPPITFDYSLISDTSLQVTDKEEGELENTLINENVLPPEDVTMVAVPSAPKRQRKGGASSLEMEEGEIIDLEGTLDDSVIFVSEEFLTPKRVKMTVSDY